MLLVPLVSLLPNTSSPAVHSMDLTILCCTSASLPASPAWAGSRGRQRGEGASVVWSNKNVVTGRK